MKLRVLVAERAAIGSPPARFRVDPVLCQLLRSLAVEQTKSKSTSKRQQAH